MSKTRAVWLFIAALTLVRLSMLGSTDLEFDEAHYWMWSERLAPGYFSKGPGIAFVIRASTMIFGPTEFGVRFWSPILAGCTSLLLFYFGKRLFNENVGLWSVIAFNVTPIFNIGAFVITTDCLSIFFWLAAMFTFWVAVEKSPRFSFWWPLTGLLIGLGFLGRFTNAFEIICVLLVLTFAPRLRQEFKRPGLYSLLAVFVVCTIPPIVWNAQHAWITTTHLRTRGGSWRECWGSLARAAQVRWSALYLLFAVAFWRRGLGSDRALPSDQSAIQNPFSVLVRTAGSRVLFSAFIQ